MTRSLEYRVTPLPPAWPGKATPVYQRTRPPFKTTTWSRTLAVLEREVRMRGGRNVEIALDIEPRHLRQDGMLRADARPRSSSVVVSFSVADGRLQFPADRFGNWVDNVEAIARSLEDLRRVDRYGVMQGRQYLGFKALPAETGATLTAEAAASLLVRESGVATSAEHLLQSMDGVRQALRAARARTHPDAGGSAERFASVGQAAEVIARHHGGSL